MPNALASMMYQGDEGGGRNYLQPYETPYVPTYVEGTRNYLGDLVSRADASLYGGNALDNPLMFLGTTNLADKTKLLQPLFDALKTAKDKADFRRMFTQSHLMDLSNHEAHRFGRAISPYKGEPYVDLGQIESEIPSYLEDIRYSYPRLYSTIRTNKDKVTMYRAVPKDAPDEIRIGDYVALDRNYAKSHGEQVLKGEQKTPYKIVSMRVPKSDVVWGNADFAEWAYSPRSIRDQYPSLEEFYDMNIGGE